MKFSPKAKGKITENLVRLILEHAGYHVVSLGIEEVISQLRMKSQEEYLKLGLPLPLRLLPDFFISGPENQYWLLEVKYRLSWPSAKQELECKLVEQAKTWEPLYLFLLLGSPAGPNGHDNTHSRMGIIKLKLSNGILTADVKKYEEIGGFESKWVKLEKPWNEVEWGDFSSISIVFDRVGKNPTGLDEQTLRKALAIINSLKEIDAIDEKVASVF